MTTVKLPVEVSSLLNKYVSHDQKLCEEGKKLKVFRDGKKKLGAKIHEYMKNNNMTIMNLQEKSLRFIIKTSKRKEAISQQHVAKRVLQFLAQQGDITSDNVQEFSTFVCAGTDVKETETLRLTKKRGRPQADEPSDGEQDQSETDE